MSESRIEQWKRKLLDLSLRNPLLNARDSLKFLPLDGGLPIPSNVSDSVSTPCEVGAVIPYKTRMSEQESRKRLKELYLTSRSMYNESGVNSLFVAVGFLSWNEKEGEELHRAPLALIPAQLIRQTAAPGYKLVRTDEDAVVNFCLVELLKSQFGIPVKDFAGSGDGDGDPDFTEIIKGFADAIQDKKEWSISQGIALGIFSFEKVVIWKDLKDHFEDFRKHKFVAHLVNGVGSFDDGVDVFPAEEFEKHLHYNRLWCPLPADSSQLAAVLYSEFGKSFVLHGPPGTGKSQTITNIIAHNLAIGKRVLFVSEKKAALDVVYKRLSSVGLAPFCLELHSNKADKANVMRQFGEALSIAPSRKPNNWATICSGLDSSTAEIGEYVRELHRKCANGLSVYDCLNRIADKNPASDASLISFNASAIAHDDIAGIAGVIRELADEWRSVDKDDYDALKIVHALEWTPEFETKVAEDAQAFLDAQSEPKKWKRIFRISVQAVKSACRRTFIYNIGDGIGERFRERFLGVLNHIDGLRLVLSYKSVRGKAEKVKCAKFVKAMEDGVFSAESALSVFEESWVLKTYDSLISNSRCLSRFSGEKQEKKIAYYKELDKKYLKGVGKDVVSILSKRVYSIEHPQSEKGEDGKMHIPAVDDEIKRALALIRRECGKKKRFMPPRRLLAETKAVATRLKPCFLMSPLSVAQYLPANSMDFDLVVFDEASQMTVWDAVGVIARGKQLICVGDPKQLPPTNFFVKGDVKDENREDDEMTEDLESILDECIANGLHSAYLNWHYRSRHESLIAFSNHFYYDDRLNTFPATQKNDRLGVSFRYVDNALYDHVSHTNRVEAERLADFLFERLENAEERKRSWGVVTFSVAQKRLVEDLIEERCSKHEWASDFFDELRPDAFFVKNLENVQGDERDVILFSVAYAPDAQGRFAMSFGPVNRQGGERRLNVAITRAREQVVIFASVHGSDIYPEKTNSIGVKHLRYLMDYAENGHIEGFVDRSISEGPLNGVPGMICKKLRAAGYSYDLDVGMSSHPVDIAVKDPEDDSRYVLGIELDGEKYRDQVTVRDRDVLRSDVLENLGWRYFRTWSVDWKLDRKHAEEELLNNLPKISRDENNCQIFA